LWTDFDEIFWRGRAWLKDQVIQCWWRSGSRFGSGSPKSEIRILRIGGGLCSLSTSSFIIKIVCVRVHVSELYTHLCESCLVRWCAVTVVLNWSSCCEMQRPLACWCWFLSAWHCTESWALWHTTIACSGQLTCHSVKFMHISEQRP